MLLYSSFVINTLEKFPEVTTAWTPPCSCYWLFSFFFDLLPFELGSAAVEFGVTSEVEVWCFPGLCLGLLLHILESGAMKSSLFIKRKGPNWELTNTVSSCTIDHVSCTHKVIVAYCWPRGQQLTHMVHVCATFNVDIIYALLPKNILQPNKRSFK